MIPIMASWNIMFLSSSSLYPVLPLFASTQTAPPHDKPWLLPIQSDAALVQSSVICIPNDPLPATSLSIHAPQPPLSLC
jgi:hypothetical protein